MPADEYDDNRPDDRNGSVDRRGLLTVDRDECLELLGRAGVGRVGLTVDALPAILPVNFSLLDGDVVFRTGWGSKLRAAADGQVVCFEVDGFDPADRTGWSVLVIGRSEVLRDRDRVARARALALEPWAPAPRDHFVLVRTEMISGRRIGPRATGNGRAPTYEGDAL